MKRAQNLHGHYSSDGEAILTFFGGFWTIFEKITCRCQNGVTGVMLVTAAQNSPNMFIFIISNYWKSFGTDICQKRTMSRVKTSLSHYSQCGGTRPKMALVTDYDLSQPYHVLLKYHTRGFLCLLHGSPHGICVYTVFCHSFSSSIIPC